MANHAGTDGTDFRIGRVIARGAQVYFQSFPVFLVVGAVAFLPLFLLSLATGGMPDYEQAMAKFEATGAANLSSFTGELWLSAGLTWVCLMLGWCWMAGGVIHGAITSLRRGRVTVGTALTASARSVVPLLMLSLSIWLFVFAVMIGSFFSSLGYFILLLLPFLGIYLCMILWVAAPALVVEILRPMEALRRAISLSNGRLWSIFSVVVLWALFNLAVWICVSLLYALLVGSMAEPAFGGSQVIAESISIIIFIVLAGLGLSVAAVGYHDLRIASEGGTGETMIQAVH